MAWFAVALPYIAYGTAIAGGVYSAQEQRKAGKLQAQSYEEQREQEKTAAREREIDRRRRLNQVLSTQMAQFSAAGVDPGTGSPANYAITSAREAARESLVDRTMTGSRSSQLSLSARSALRSGRSQAGQTLFNTAQSAYTNYPGG